MSDLGVIHHRGPWQISTHATRVLCADGRRRYARIHGEPDTFFSQPASVKVAGHWVSGYLTGREVGGERDVAFVAVSGRTWSHLLVGYAHARNDYMQDGYVWPDGAINGVNR